jgi:hypothetical protein
MYVKNENNGDETNLTIILATMKEMTVKNEIMAIILIIINNSNNM